MSTEREPDPHDQLYQFTVDIPFDLHNPIRRAVRSAIIPRDIPFTNSTDWGPPKVATARALIEPNVTNDNERLFRTFHPSLRLAASVGIGNEPDGKRIWCLEFLSEAPSELKAGGLEIHIIPTAWPHNGKEFCRVFRDPIYHVINPRYILTKEELTCFSRVFPNALGAQILIANRLNVVYASWDLVEKDWSGGIPCTFGGLSIRFSLLEIIPAPIEQGRSNSVVAGNGEAKATGCPGLALKMINGERMLTTATHGFVYVPKDGLLGRGVKLFNWIKDSLPRFGSSQATTGNASAIGHIGTGDGSGNSPIGKDVWLRESNIRVGTITHSCDRPSSYLPYPAGYACDLSLAELYTSEIPSPILGPGPRIAIVDSWAKLNRVLQGEPLFLTREVLHSDNSRSYVVPTTERSGARKSEREHAIAEGVYYFLDRTHRTTSVSLLWRTIPKRQSQQHGLVAGACGAMLCMGDIKIDAAKGAVFQNYEVPVRMPKVDNGQNGVLSDKLAFNIMGGFILPKEIYEAKIIRNP